MAKRGVKVATARPKRAVASKVMCPTCRRPIADVVRNGRGKVIGTFCVACWNADKAGAVPPADARGHVEGLHYRPNKNDVRCIECGATPAKLALSDDCCHDREECEVRTVRARYRRGS